MKGKMQIFLTVKLKVCGKCIQLILVYGPQEKVPESTRETLMCMILVPMVNIY